MRRWKPATARPAHSLPCSARRWGQHRDDTSNQSKTRDSLRVAEVDHHRGGAEPVCLVTYVQNSNREPNAADGFRQVIQIPPDVTADEKPDEWEDGVLQ